MSKWKKFNVNDFVKIKLTDYGKELLESGKLRAHVPRKENGFYVLQLWELMNVFGEHVGNGCKIPFETAILLEVKDE